MDWKWQRGGLNFMTFFPEDDEWRLCGKWISKGVLGLGQDQSLPSKAGFHTLPSDDNCTSLVRWLSIKFCQWDALGRLEKKETGQFYFCMVYQFFPITMDGLHMLPAPSVLGTISASSSISSLAVGIARVGLPAFWRAGAKSLSQREVVPPEEWQK